MKDVKKQLGLGGIGFAFLFFLNPNLHVIDFLPDFFGYILLCRALSRLANLNELIDSAVALFRKMILVDAGKWLAILWIFGMSAAAERSSSMLLWSFVFSTVELIVLIPAYTKLFGGLTQLGYFYSDQEIFGTKNQGKKKSRTDRIRNLTIGFVTMKSVLTVLPEFADLTNSSYNENASAVLNLHQYIGFLRVLAFIPILFVGLIWFFRITAYFRALRGDRALMEGLRNEYREKILPKVGMFVRRGFRLAEWLLIIAVILSVDFRIDQKNFIPDILSAIVFFAFFFVISKQVTIKKAAWLLPTFFYAFISIASTFAEWKFFDEYYYGAIWRSDKALAAYQTILVLDVLKSVLFLGVMLSATWAIFEVILKHTGYVLGRERVGEREEQMIADLQKELRSTVFLAMVFAVLYAISDVAYSFLVPEFGFMGAINLFFATLCVVFVIRSLSTIRQAVDTKYMLES